MLLVMVCIETIFNAVKLVFIFCGVDILLLMFKLDYLSYKF